MRLTSPSGDIRQRQWSRRSAVVGGHRHFGLQRRL